MPPPVHSLYVHVPFCAHKCAYCAFYSEASSGALIERYVHALCRELEMVAGELEPNTIFFGGGTPSLLNLRQWEQILTTMARLKLTDAAEWTVECNPATVSLDKAKLLRAHGVNRISMGVQSFDDDLLERLGRIHTREMVFKSFAALRAAGFKNINIDLMFAIPGQTREVWRATLAEALALGSEHLSSYEVIYEEDTPLYAQLQAREFDVDEGLACEMFEDLVERAGAAGFRQYEIANFARDVDSKPADGRAREGTTAAHEPHAERRLQPAAGISGQATFLPPEGGVPQTVHQRGEDGDAATTGDLPDRACQHNINYWRGGAYHGLGPSAAGYVQGVRTKNWSNTQLYCEQLEQGRRAIESKEELAPVARAGEVAAFGLRMNAGWPFEQFEAATGWDSAPGVAR